MEEALKPIFAAVAAAIPEAQTPTPEQSTGARLSSSSRTHILHHLFGTENVLSFIVGLYNDISNTSQLTWRKVKYHVPSQTCPTVMQSLSTWEPSLSLYFSCHILTSLHPFCFWSIPFNLFSPLLHQSHTYSLGPILSYLHSYNRLFLLKNIFLQYSFHKSPWLQFCLSPIWNPHSKSQYIITKLLGIKHLYLNVSWEILHHQISFSQDSRLLCLCLGFCLIVIPQCWSCPALYIWLIFVLPGPLHILLHLFISLECESPKGDQVFFISVFPERLIPTELACIHEHMPFLFNYIKSKSHNSLSILITGNQTLLLFLPLFSRNAIKGENNEF